MALSVGFRITVSLLILLPKLRGSDSYPGGTVSHRTRQPSLDAQRPLLGSQLRAHWFPQKRTDSSAPPTWASVGSGVTASRSHFAVAPGHRDLVLQSPFRSSLRRDQFDRSRCGILPRPSP